MIHLYSDTFFIGHYKRSLIQVMAIEVDFQKRKNVKVKHNQYIV